MAEKWTKTSALPSDGAMKPNPLSALNHLTVPCAILAFLPGGAPPLDEEAGRRGASRQEAHIRVDISRKRVLRPPTRLSQDCGATNVLGQKRTKKSWRVAARSGGPPPGSSSPRSFGGGRARQARTHPAQSATPCAAAHAAPLPVTTRNAPSQTPTAKSS